MENEAPQKGERPKFSIEMGLWEKKTRFGKPYYSGNIRIFLNEPKKDPGDHPPERKSPPVSHSSITGNN